jgi:aminopeptidase-like protein
MQEIKEISNLLEQLFPICRSITGNGVRQTLSILKEKTDFEILEIPTGIKCYDWTIPKEWNVIDAYVKDSNGNKIIDFQKNNLHLKSYSVPINKVISFKELNLHLETLPDMPDAIPYRTTYYKEDWGFCISYNQYINLNKNSNYEVVINTSLKKWLPNIW